MAKKAKSVKEQTLEQKLWGAAENFVAILMLQNIRVWYWDLCS